MVHTRLLSSRRPPTSCQTCFAWGLLPGRHCGACYSFGQNHVADQCAGCRRIVPLKKDYCRLCWCQASLEAQGEVTVLAPYLQRIRHHQLFFAWMHKPRQPGPRLGKQGRYVCKPRYQLPPLLILLSGHVQDDKIRYSDLFPALRARGLTVERTVEVLDQLGLFDDDRVPTFERWLDRKLADVAPGIRRDVQAWLRERVTSRKRADRLGAQQHDQQYDQRGWPGRRGEKADQAQGLRPLGDRDPDRGADFFSQAHSDRLPGVRGYLSGLTLGHGARRGNDCPRIASGLVVGVQPPCSGLRR